jgi:toxin ParE1/3/4
VRRFRNYLIFYRPTDGGIEVIRVLHAARDISSILAEEGD